MKKEIGPRQDLLLLLLFFFHSSLKQKKTKGRYMGWLCSIKVLFIFLYTIYFTTMPRKKIWKK